MNDDDFTAMPPLSCGCAAMLVAMVTACAFVVVAAAWLVRRIGKR